MPSRRLQVTRHFDAPIEHVWRAWTQSDLLEQWWAPKPWETKTKVFNFEEGGSWLYQIINPKEPGIWALIEFTSIKKCKSFDSISFFCDESGKKNLELPVMYHKNNFKDEGLATTVEIEITFNRESELKTIIEMGFETGFTSALKNLEELLEIMVTNHETKIK